MSGPEGQESTLTKSGPEGLSLTTFLSLLAERFARQRLQALARVQGKADTGIPVVLFEVGIDITQEFPAPGPTRSCAPPTWW